jgi:hypothetical protein
MLTNSSLGVTQAVNNNNYPLIILIILANYSYIVNCSKNKCIKNAHRLTDILNVPNLIQYNNHHIIKSGGLIVGFCTSVDTTPNNNLQLSNELYVVCTLCRKQWILRLNSQIVTSVKWVTHHI